MAHESSRVPHSCLKEDGANKENRLNIDDMALILRIKIHYSEGKTNSFLKV